MVDVMGHVAMGLLWALPAWIVWDDRVSLAFVGFAAAASMLPDVDLVLSSLFPAAIHHHGVTHTVVFVVGIAVVAGAITAAALAEPLARWTSARFDERSTFTFATAGYAAGGLSHVFADMLSAPDISTPIEPLWPVVEGWWGLDLIWYNSPWWNAGLLTVALAAHAAVVVSTDSFGVVSGRDAT
ncbi:LexA-binding, inner membrane-associated putative hydrolase [Natronoarchaeum philippinense]|uniref:LexA-binding, inner membrane-associated putative hydrolase n=1 Tax=Natronoarchaeum philippinense TaxID=558529 RepID=A0A285NTN8_NATPI|nr:metal-dependent hydrolase [Natronoarchaeum philippinense]SNZ12273.1 LexA-binding, inner membrane-associated putative hydrolase [Natronoarchaeum philippinense]